MMTNQIDLGSVAPADEDGAWRSADQARHSWDQSRDKRIRCGSLTQGFRERFYPNADCKDWNDWQWQLRKRLQSRADIEIILNLSASERAALDLANQRLSVGITPYYASLMDADSADDPIRRTVIPVTEELNSNKDEYRDPLAEDEHSPVPGIVHRYPDRVLFLTTDYCPVYCRYCTRSRLVGGKAPFDSNIRRWQTGVDYIAAHPQVRDVLISGGDPLIFGDDRIDWLLRNLRAIPHLEIIRIGTKVPFVLPQRITEELTDILRRYHPLYMSLHVIHPREITSESAQACERLADGGIPLGSQTVLLRGINDHVDTIGELMHALLRIRVKPYYLLQCDPVYGTTHFRTPVQTGVSLIQGLRGHTSGYAVPHYIIDLPEGGGKVSMDPAYMTGLQQDHIVFTNYQGRPGFRYPDAESFRATPDSETPLEISHK